MANGLTFVKTVPVIGEITEDKKRRLENYYRELKNEPNHSFMLMEPQRYPVICRNCIGLLFENRSYIPTLIGNHNRKCLECGKVFAPYLD